MAKALRRNDEWAAYADRVRAYSVPFVQKPLIGNPFPWHIICFYEQNGSEFRYLVGNWDDEAVNFDVTVRPEMVKKAYAIMSGREYVDFVFGSYVR
jgi:hypothetical protein